MIIPLPLSLISFAIAIAITCSGESPPSYIWFALMTALLLWIATMGRRTSPDT